MFSPMMLKFLSALGSGLNPDRRPSAVAQFIQKTPVILAGNVMARRVPLFEAAAKMRAGFA